MFGYDHPAGIKLKRMTKEWADSNLKRGGNFKYLNVSHPHKDEVTTSLFEVTAAMSLLFKP